MTFDFGSHFLSKIGLQAIKAPRSHWWGYMVRPEVGCECWPFSPLYHWLAPPSWGSTTLLPTYHHSTGGKHWPFFPWRFKRFSLDICSCMCTSHFGGTFGDAAYLTQFGLCLYACRVNFFLVLITRLLYLHLILLSKIFLVTLLQLWLWGYFAPAAASLMS